VEISKGRFFRLERRCEFVNKIARISNLRSGIAILSCIAWAQDSLIRLSAFPFFSSYAPILHNGKAEFCRKPFISPLAQPLLHYITRHIGAVGLNGALTVETRAGTPYLPLRDYACRSQFQVIRPKG
jgi:hypothetical protein